MQEHDPARTLVFHPGARSVVYFGAFRFDLADGLLARDGEEIRLPPRALVILRYLVRAAGRVVSKQTLMDATWKDAYVSETSLTEAIGLIRQALGDDPQKPEYIQTVHRRGYRFIAPIATDVSASPLPGLGRAPRPIGTPQEGAETATVVPPAVRRRPRRARVAWLGLGAVAAIAAGAIAWLAWRASAASPVVRLSLTLSAGQAPAPSLIAHPAVTISPNGQLIVYVGGAPGASRLFVRRLDQFEAVPLPGTDGAHGPFFSPDGRWVAFFAGGQVKKVAIDGGGEAQVLCATATGVGGAWLSRGEIVFAPSWTGPLMRVSASGGAPALAAAPAAGYSYRWPDRIDDRTIIATRWRSGARDAAVVAISLPSGEERVIVEPAVFGRSVPGGFVAFVRGGDVYAVRVDATHKPRGAPTRVLPSVLTGMTGAAQLAVAPNGTVLYIGDVEERSHRVFARVDARGESADLPIPPRAFQDFAVCGDRIAAIISEQAQSDLWVGYLDRAALTRITREGSSFDPIWSADCRTLAFGWNLTGVANIHTLRLDSSDPPQPIVRSRWHQSPGSWSHDARWLAYVEQRPDTANDIWLRDGSTGEVRPFVATPAHELLPRLSPDGRWIAYESNASGRFEIVAGSIEAGSRVQVSSEGGTWPAWSADGRHLFFKQDRTVMRLSVSERGGELMPGSPVPVFSHPDLVLFRPSPDGLVWLRGAAERLPLTRMDLVLGWASELERQVQ